MKRWSWLFAAGAACALIMAPFQCSIADNSGSEKGWGLLLNSPHVGMLYVYVTPEGIAVVYPKTGARIVTHSPNWKVVFYNDKTKVYYTEKMEDVKQYGKTTRARNQLARARTTLSNGTRKGKTDTIAGVSATQYYITTMSDNGPRQAEAWITQELKPPAQFSELMGKLFSFDASNFPQGMPLRVKLSDEAGRKNLYFDTVKIQPQTIKTASFTYPASYQRVDSEVEVVVDAESREKMKSILEDSSELDSILGSKSSGSRYSSSYSSGGSGSRYSTSSSARSYTPTATARPAAPAAKPANSNDWFGNVFKSLGGGK